MKILAFDTANNNNDVAILDDDKIIAENKIGEESSQAETLVPSIEQCLQNAGLKYEDMNLIAVTKGPGNFTGIRIAFSVAKTISLVTDIPLITFNNLEVLAFEYLQKSVSTQNLLVVLDAKLDEFFIQEFAIVHQKLEPKYQPKLIKYLDINNYLPQNDFIIIGSGKKIATDLIKTNLNLEILEKEDTIKAATIGLMALDIYKKNDGKIKDLENEILYVREPNITNIPAKK